MANESFGHPPAGQAESFPNASPEVKRTFAELRDARLKLARLVSATPEPSKAKRFKRQLFDVNENKERLEQRLASLSPATERALAIRDAKVGDVLALLPAGVAVIDITRSIRFSAG